MARFFEEQQQTVYAVGGAVRNALLGLDASDMDVCGSARPSEVLSFCQGTAIHAVDRAAHFGTTELHLADAQGRHMAEYTTFRVDSYRGGHRPDSVRFADSPEEDALRRDFSMNALYRPLTSQGAGEVIDPTGGLRHMRDGVLHTVTADPDLVLKDDGLRILRAARFQAELGYRPSEALLASARRFAPSLAEIARERLRDELQKTLLADLRYPPVSQTRGELPRLPSSSLEGLRTLVAVDAWPYLLGQLAFDAHAAEALSQYSAPDDALAGRLALLLHTSPVCDVLTALQTLRFSTKTCKTAALFVDTAQRMADGRLTRYEAAQAGREALLHARNAFAALKQRDALTRAETMRDDLRNAPFSLAELAVGGDELTQLCDLLGVSHARIGTALHQLWQEVCEGALPNESAALQNRAKKILQD